MKCNRRRTRRMSVVASHTMHVFGVIVVLFAMVIVNMLASSSSTQLQKTIGERNKTLASLENDLRREGARWDSMKTIDRLERTLAGFGMNMKYPKQVQIVRMNAKGEPLVAQNSVKEALRRQGAVATASYRQSVPAARAAVSSARVATPPRVRSARRVRR